MAMPPNTGGPPQGPDPQRPEGHDSRQPGGQGPQQQPDGTNPQAPPPGTGPPQPAGPPANQYPPSGYPSSEPPQPGGYPPGGPLQPGGYPPSGPPQSGGYPPSGPPPTGGYTYQWAPQGPPPKPHRTGLIVGIIAIAAVLVLGGLALIALNLTRDQDEPSASESQTETGEDEARPDLEGQEEPGIAGAVGSCLPFEPVLIGVTVDLTTSCDSAAAFWEVTEASDTVDVTANADGTISDPQPVYDICGAEYARFDLGERWKDFYFTYDETTRAVEEFYCVEAVGNPDDQGRLPVTPATGDCFDDSERWWTVPCGDAGALYVVVDTVQVDPPAVMTVDEADAASAPCSGGAYLWQVTDIEGRTTAILCGDYTS